MFLYSGQVCVLEHRLVDGEGFISWYRPDNQFEYRRIEVVLQPVYIYISMPAFPVVNTGALNASGHCRPNTKATKSR